MKNKKLLLIIIAGICIAIGIALGDTQLIFHKAIFVCLECIGLG